jgi:hypothetical protein
MTLAQKLDTITKANALLCSLLPDIDEPTPASNTLEGTEGLILESALGSVENLMALYRDLYQIEVSSNA